MCLSLEEPNTKILTLHKYLESHSIETLQYFKFSRAGSNFLEIIAAAFIPLDK